MTAIKNWSTTAATNGTAGSTPDFWPENQAPSTVNDCAREMMAQVRDFYSSVEWREFASDSAASPTGDCHTCSYVAATQFQLASGDGDVTSIYHAGRRVWVVTPTFTQGIYGTISTSTFGTFTTVTVNWDSITLISEALTVHLGVAVTGSPVFAQGMIMLWSGSTATIPGGWQICDGTNGTPDLRDRFVLAAGFTYAVGALGGDKDAPIVNHTHTGNTDNESAHTHPQDATTRLAASAGFTLTGGSTDGVTGGTTGAGSAHSHTFTTGNPAGGVSATNANMPPYYALAYIMCVT